MLTQTLSLQLKRRLTYAILMAGFAWAARYVVDYLFPTDEEA